MAIRHQDFRKDASTNLVAHLILRLHQLEAYCGRNEKNGVAIEWLRNHAEQLQQCVKTIEKAERQSKVLSLMYHKAI